MVLISNAESLQHNSNSTNSSIRHSYIACTWTAGSTFQSEVTVWVVPSCTGKTQTLELASSTTHYGCAKRLKAPFTDFDVSCQYTLTLDKRKKQCKENKQQKTEIYRVAHKKVCTHKTWLDCGNVTDCRVRVLHLSVCWRHSLVMLGSDYRSSIN